MTQDVARWRCETCRDELTMPAGFCEWGYSCCYASMTFLGLTPSDSDGSPKGEDAKQGSVEDDSAAIAQGATP